MPNGFKHARRYYGKPHQKGRYEICLKCSVINAALGKFDFVVEVYDLKRKPGNQVINRYGLSPEFWDVAKGMKSMTFKRQSSIEYLIYDPDRDDFHKEGKA